MVTARPRSPLGYSRAGDRAGDSRFFGNGAFRCEDGIPQEICLR